MNKPNPQQKQSKKTTIKKLIELIENELSNFPDSLEYITILEQKKNENQHSDAFCTFMTFACKAKYYFGRETSQQGSSTIDISVREPGGLVIFTIEAKVLPIPISGERKEYEYVCGKGGGIQRFKDNKHGLDDSLNLLPENAMIAYIKEQDFDYWLEQVNQWIVNAGWSVEETLNHKYENVNGKYISKHTRIDNSPLTLHHFWVMVNNH